MKKRIHQRPILVTTLALMAFVVLVTAVVGRILYNEFNHENADSVARSVGTCARSNPSRAYLLLRAGEFKVVNGGPSYTTQIAPEVLPVLDCEATVANEGVPVPLCCIDLGAHGGSHVRPGSMQDRYLRLFQRGYVSTVEHGRIVSEVPFHRYFSGKRKP